MKKLYKQLNRLNFEIDVEPMEVSELEKERIKRSVLKVKRKKHLTRNFVAAATFLIASSITIGFSFPTFASNIPIVGNVFELFYDDEEYIFEKYDEFSSKLGITQESNGVEVTLTDAVYDGENITVAYTLKSNQNLGERPVLFGDFIAEEFKNAHKYGGFSENYIVEKVNDHEYAVLFIYELIHGPRPEEVHITLQSDEIVDLSNTSQSVKGNWSFHFKLNTLERETFNLAKEHLKTEAEGIEVSVTKLTETSVSTTLYFAEKVDEELFTKEREEWRSVSIDYVISDDLGRNYNFVHYRGGGHNTDFDSLWSKSRITTNVFDEQATSITITPIVHVNKKAGNGGKLERIGEPFKMEPITVPLK
ncbi:DUF4179 domain-containing protein [Ureibacillus sp. FSL E2-3493]|uniref:DUF4179 domain-containing protein n=1 Tax=Ureibacillus sp. FSL E2-3493 TaxID=2921367 RepID=UPI0031194ADB